MRHTNFGGLPNRFFSPVILFLAALESCQYRKRKKTASTPEPKVIAVHVACFTASLISVLNKTLKNEQNTPAHKQKKPKLMDALLDAIESNSSSEKCAITISVRA
jgi:hypothetical protein